MNACALLYYINSGCVLGYSDITQCEQCSYNYGNNCTPNLSLYNVQYLFYVVTFFACVGLHEAGIFGSRVLTDC